MPEQMEPMEARSVDEIPRGDEWQYEPKWDGFRCILFRDADQVRLQSKSGQDLTRYFPEVARAAKALRERHFTLDGELVVSIANSFSFDRLLQRVHPAPSRIRRLSEETPALFIAFDILRRGRTDLMRVELAQRRHVLEAFAERSFRTPSLFRLSPATRSFAQARRWLKAAGGGSDGVIAKRVDLPYQGGNRDGMQKIKLQRSADCVIGGYRYATRHLAGRKVIGSLLLGLYGADGLLHHVGFSSSLKADERRDLTDRLERLATDHSFTGNTPGGPSRWSSRRSDEWQPVKPRLVVEVGYDHFSGSRFRHGTTILRWRPDKKPEQCRMDQLKQRSALPKLLRAA